MLKQIKTLIKSFKNKPINHLQAEKDWLQIVIIYDKCTEERREFLILQLSQCFSISREELHTIFVPLNKRDINDDIVRQTLADFRKAQAQVEDEKVEQFKQRALKRLPLLDLSLNHEEWIELSQRFEKSKKKHLRSAFFITEISRMRNTDYNQLTRLISKKNPPRRAKVERDSPSTAAGIRACKHRYRSDDKENSLIFQATEVNKHLHSPVQATGARIAELEPATPEKGYKTLKKTPGGSKVRPVYSNFLGSFFKPLTPYGKKTQSGMVDISQGKHRQIRALVFTRPEKTKFVATLETLRTQRNSHNKKMSPTRFTGARCHDVFKAHGSGEEITISGQDYHWSHLIAEFLGGGQLVIPGTAASNYNTLEVVERFIARKLIQDGVEAIEIEVTCEYSGENLIPDELVFCLRWKPANVEVIHINPRSYQRITDSMHRSIELLRSLNDLRDESLTSIADEELDFNFEAIECSLDFEGIFPPIDDIPEERDISEDNPALDQDELGLELEFEGILALENVHIEGEDVSYELYSSSGPC